VSNCVWLRNLYTEEGKAQVWAVVLWRWGGYLQLGHIYIISAHIPTTLKLLDRAMKFCTTFMFAENHKIADSYFVEGFMICHHCKFHLSNCSDYLSLLNRNLRLYSLIYYRKAHNYNGTHLKWHHLRCFPHVRCPNNCIWLTNTLPFNTLSV
jgi:hypothetical protein